LLEQRIWVAINFFVYFSAFVAVVLIVVAGYGFMTSAGDPEKVKNAQKTLTAAIVGMVIVFTARMIGLVLLIGVWVKGSDGGEPGERWSGLYSCNTGGTVGIVYVIGVLYNNYRKYIK